MSSPHSYRPETDTREDVPVAWMVSHNVVVTERTERMPRITTTVHHSRVVALAWNELPPIRQLDLREGAAAGEDAPTCGDKASSRGGDRGR